MFNTERLEATLAVEAETDRRLAEHRARYYSSLPAASTQRQLIEPATELQANVREYSPGTTPATERSEQMPAELEELDCSDNFSAKSDSTEPGYFGKDESALDNIVLPRLSPTTAVRNRLQRENSDSTQGTSDNETAKSRSRTNSKARQGEVTPVPKDCSMLLPSGIDLNP